MMNTDKQRIAIAEACGWTDCRIYYPEIGKWELGGVHPKEADKLNWENLPDYLTDLNAMHEAESVLTLRQQHGLDSYADWLWQITREAYTGGEHGGGSTWLVATATAAQRAEAFLKTLNLWTDQ